MSFHVGQKVVCVDGEVFPWEPGPYVMDGAIYTITHLLDEEITGPWGYGVETTLIFAELPINICPPWHIGYSSDCFRPVNETNLDVFREMLVKPKVVA